MDENIEWLQFSFSIGSWSISAGQILGIVLTFLFIFLLYRLVINKILPWYYTVDSGIPEKEREGIRRTIMSILFLVLAIGLLIFLRFDYVLFTHNDFTLRVSTLFEGVLILQLARLLDRTLSRVLANTYQKTHPNEPTDFSTSANLKAGKTIQYIVYIVAAMYAIRVMQFDLTRQVAGVDLSISNILLGILIILLARLIVWIFTQIVMTRYYTKENVNVGSQYAINQLVKYIVFVLAVLIALDNLGIEMTVLWGGAAALLVGLGLGLQQTFMDLVSGLILLFERSVEVGDVVKVDDLVGTITQIGLRTSNLLTRENITVIIPNSKLTIDNVVNWSHFTNHVRFSITVGVAYGSNTKKVKKALLAVADENTYVLKTPGPFVRFVDFADSSLNMELHFWTKNLLISEDIKSDLRFAINDSFNEKEIEIPFPQRVVWHQKGEEPLGSAEHK